jgi:hypothetical protein
MQPNRNGPQGPSWPAPGWCIEPVAFSSSTRGIGDVGTVGYYSTKPQIPLHPESRAVNLCGSCGFADRLSQGDLQSVTTGIFSLRRFRPPDSARTFSSRFHLTTTSKGKISAATPLFCFVQNSLQFLGADARYHQRRHHIGFRSDRIAVSSQIDNNRYAYFAISERLFEAHFLRGRKNAR